ncbi:MAG: DUF4080 domain-containing protein [Deltaproteobacteria bacterium]|nr:DUF4080 domain-containing protein [Deltaproteobacteria bacterium]
MRPILLTTLNARYSHCAFGLRYLYANLKELQPQAQIREFTINQAPRDIAEAILAQNPRLVGFGVYIWNTRQTRDVVSLLKRLRPELLIILGGPEVTFETESQELCQLADLTIQGESDFLFYEICRDYLANGSLPGEKWVSGPLPEIAKIAMPYSLYSDDDLNNRVLYVEASRGCPYKCEYCLSSLDKSVRNFDTDAFLSEMDKLIARGARQFKFVDRTFNLSIATSSRILRFFLDRIGQGLFLHFEMVPDRLPVELRELIAKFPPGSLQFEIGIQTWNPQVATLVSRRMDFSKVVENFAYLTSQTGVHIHADLIAGLPGETVESFAQGFDAVALLRPQEIQVGILKRLKGTPIIRHDTEWQMVYQDNPPFQVLQTRTMSFETLQGIDRFSHYWNLLANSGNFGKTMQLLDALAAQRPEPSRYWEFDQLARALAQRHPQNHGVALLNLLESVWLYLTVTRGQDADEVREILIADYSGGTTRRDVPPFLRKHQAAPTRKTADATATPKRQQQHLRGEAATSAVTAAH